MIPDACIADKTIQLAGTSQDLIDRALIIGITGHVAFHRQNMFTKSLTQTGDFRRRQFQRGNLRAFFDKSLDQRQP